MTLAAASLALIETLLAACAPKPEQDVKQTYLANRQAVVDSSQPCWYTPLKPFKMWVARNQIFLPVMINGVPTLGLMDTGGAASMVTPEVAAAAHLEVTSAKEKFYGTTGAFTAQLTKLNRIQIGSINITGHLFTRVYGFPGSDGTKIGALIGLDWLSHFDWDIDVPRRTMQPWEIDNCLTIDPPWPNTFTGFAITFSAGPGAPSQGVAALAALFGEPMEATIPVAFEGGILDAVFDTGAMHSMLSHDGAHQAGVTNAQLEADQVEKVTGAGGQSEDFYVHNFPAIAVGEQALHDMKMHVAKHFDRRDEPMILGMDYIGKQHLWLSFRTEALYIDSGERKKITPPLDRPHRIGGLFQPPYPEGAKGRSGEVVADCVVQTDGTVSGCRISKSSGIDVFDNAVMGWLTGPNAPIMQPKFVNGVAVRANNSWDVNFEPYRH